MSDVLARADPVPRMVAYLAAHPDVTAELGGPGRVSSLNEPPYPHLRVTALPGDDRDLRWLIAADVQLEAYGDLDGTPGMAALARICRIAQAVLADLPYVAPGPGEPVITHVASTRGGGPLTEASGQPKYLAVVRCWAHPAT